MGPTLPMQAVATFLRVHAADLDKRAVGEYLGNHHPSAMAAMHAYIDQVGTYEAVCAGVLSAVSIQANVVCPVFFSHLRHAITSFSHMFLFSGRLCGY